MKGIDLKTVAAEIDATGNIDLGRQVAIKYVTAKGNIRKMVVSKRNPVNQVKGYHKSETSAPARKNPHMKDNALIPVIDHAEDGQAKNLFLFGIIGFNPNPNADVYYPIIRGDVSKMDQ